MIILKGVWLKMRCPECGKDVPETARFCGFCGAALAAPEETSGTETVSRKRSSPIVWLLILALLVCGGVIVYLLIEGNDMNFARSKEGELPSELVGTWYYYEGSNGVSLTLYSSGMLEIQFSTGGWAAGNAEGQWMVVKGNKLKLSLHDGTETETITAPIGSVRDGCLTLTDGSQTVRFWDSKQKAMNAG